MNEGEPHPETLLEAFLARIAAMVLWGIVLVSFPVWLGLFWKK